MKHNDIEGDCTADRIDFPDSRIGASLKLRLALRLGQRLGGTSPIRESGPH